MSMVQWVDAAAIIETKPVPPLPKAPRGDRLAQAWDEGYAAAREELAARPSPVPEPTPEPRRPVPVREGPSFGEYLKDMRKRAGLTQHALAKLAGVDPSYATRCEEAKREPPRRHIVEAMASGLKLSASERRRLLTLGGHAPVPEWTPALDAVAERLATLADRTAFEAIICALCRHWSEEVVK